MKCIKEYSLITNLLRYCFIRIMDESKAMHYLTLCIALVVLSNVSIVKGDEKISEESKIRIKRNSLVKSDYGE